MADLPTTIGRYEVVSRLGQGGMGSLFLAKDPKIGRLVAIKLVRQEFDSPDARQRFAREAQAAGTLRHQNIVTIFDVDEHEGLPFIAMEYIDGQTLGEIVRRKSPIDPQKRLQWIEDLCGALAYAHRQGVIHRDIKPANLMVDTEGTLKILDFGLARRDTSTFTLTQTLIGTPNYMSPEQIKGGDIDTRSDIFSVGSVLYEILAYLPAFPGTVHQAMHKILNEAPVPIETVVPGLDPRVSAVIQRALEKEVARRYPDLTIMKHELAAARLPPTHDQPFETIRIDQSTKTSGVRRSIPTPAAARFSAESLQRRRNEQIEKKLEEARAKFEAGQIEKARAACDEALFIDPQVPAALRLMADITAEVEKRHVAVWVSDARMALAKGQLDVATSKANEALALQPTAPEVIQLLDAIDAATREQARARQIQEAIKRARAALAEGAFESVVRTAAEVLAVDPGNPIATELQLRARESLEEIRLQHERNMQAEELLAEALVLRDRGDRAAAIARLTAFPHQHDGVAEMLLELKSAPEPVVASPPPPPPPPPTAPPAAASPPAPVAAASPVVVAAPPPPAAVAPPIVVEIPKPVAVVVPDPPQRAEAVPRPKADGIRPARAAAVTESSWLTWRTAAAATIVLVAVVSVAVMMGGGQAGPQSNPPVNPQPAPAPASPPPQKPRATPPADPGALTPPARVVNDAVKSRNDDDFNEAYSLLTKSQVDAADKILQQIRKRDPNYEGLRDLQNAINRARELERAAGKKPGI